MAPHSGERRPPAWQDRSVLLRSSALAAGLALALVGCGAVMPGAKVDVQAVASQDGPGVSDESVKVVFIAVDLDAVQKLTGFETASVGDQEAQIQALEDWVNDNGGLGGRDMEAVYRLYDAAKDTPAAEEQLCNQITQDDKAFAVVLTGQYQPNARPCYAQRQTLMLDAALMPHDEQYYEELHPYLWTASYPEYGAFATGMVDALDEQGFFEGADRIGVIASDSEVNRRVGDNLVVPALEKLGVEADLAWIDSTDTTTIFTGLTQAATTYQGKGVDRVMFLGGARMAPLFASVSGTTGFTARMAVSSFDNPTYFVNNPTKIPEGVTDGMVGLGFHPPVEVKDDVLPFPGDQEKVCTDIYADGGVEFASRESARVALPYCDATRLLKLGADQLDGSLNATSWAEAIGSAGAEFTTASGFGGALGGDSHAAAGGYFLMRFDDGCGCYVYEGEERSFDAE